MPRHAGKADSRRSSRMLQPSKQANQHPMSAQKPKEPHTDENTTPRQPKAPTTDGKSIVRALVRYSPQALEDQCDKLKETNAKHELALSKALSEVEELKRHRVSATNAVNTTLEELTRVRSKAETDKRRLRQQLECLHRELASSQARLAESQTTVLGMRYELDALVASFYAFASEKQMLELALADAQAKAQTEVDAARVAYDTLFSEQKKNIALEKKLMETKALYISATTRGTAAELVSDDASLDSTSNFSDISGITVLEMELERDMYRAQEQEAVQAFEAEKELRQAAEKDRDTYRTNEQLAVAAIEAHKMAYITAEKDKMAIVAQLEAAYEHLNHLQAQDGTHFANISTARIEAPQESLPGVYPDRVPTANERPQIEFGTVSAGSVPVCYSEAPAVAFPRDSMTLPPPIIPFEC